MPPPLYTINSLMWTTMVIVSISSLQIMSSSATSAFNNSYNADSHSYKASGSYAEHINGDIHKIWTDLGNIIRYVVQSCNASSLSQKQNNSGSSSKWIIEDCLKKKSLLAIDRALNLDVISIGNGAVTFKWKHEDEDNMARSWMHPPLPFTNTSDWGDSMKRKLLQFIKTRVVNIRLSGLNFSQLPSENREFFEGRGRRRGNMMAQLMMFALVAAGIIVIPMGFQFLAVLGGKALLLAKLALLLTSIQGLKKIATSHINYGLYSHGGGGPCLLFLPIDLCATYRYLTQDDNLFLPEEPYNSHFDPYNTDIEPLGEIPFKIEPHFEHPAPYDFEPHIGHGEPNLNVHNIESTGHLESYDPVENVVGHVEHVETIQSFDPTDLNHEIEDIKVHHHHVHDFNFEDHHGQE